MPQTDGRTLREPRGEIYLQIIQQKWREEEEEGERVETRESRGKKSRGGGGQREKQGLSQVVQSAKQV